jgi:hypothetical protein
MTEMYRVVHPRHDTRTEREKCMKELIAIADLGTMLLIICPALSTAVHAAIKADYVFEDEQDSSDLI